MNNIRRIFYPTRYTKKYGKLAKWSFIKTCVMSIENTLGTSSIISSLGYEQDNTAMIASFNYLGKDIIGQLGSLIYIHNTKPIDKRYKQATKQNIYMHELSVILDITTPYMGGYFIFGAGISSILKNITWMTFGAINSKCIQKIQKNNVGEIYMKLSMINTIASTLGMSIGLLIIYLIPDIYTRSFTLIPLFMIKKYSYNIILEIVKNGS